MPHLTTVPNFVFPNGNESPIQVSYYNGSIELSQVELGSTKSTAIILSPEIVRAFLNEILKHQPEANKILNK